MRLLSFLLVAAVGTACGETITLTDDIDFTWDFGITLSRFEEELHTPYVKGAQVTLQVYSDDDDRRFEGWRLTSSDPSVFEINRLSTTQYSLHGDGVAVGEGTSEITIRDDRGRVRGRGTVEVVAPDRIELEHHAYLIMGRRDEAAVDDARIVAGGTSTYLVRYFRGDRELNGNGVLDAIASDGITPEPRTTFLFENREWLSIHTSEPTSGSIELFADGESMGTFPVEVVPESEIEDVVLIAKSEHKAEPGDWLVVLAQAYDDQGRRLFGVDYEWMVDGVMQLGDGDLYRYKYDPDQPRLITARRGQHSDSITIHAESGFVDSSNDIGCSSSSPTSGAIVFAGLALVLARRRRKAAAQA
jgi:uncharacterized protein (TIGR03382 family)